MKMYVEDLLVKNCSCCDFCYTNSQGCVCKLTGHITKYNESLQEMRSKCPLQSLSDYTKQVKKEVCEEIGRKITMIAKSQPNHNIGFDCEDIQISCLEITSVLDQIQGE